ncbi:hypothetical protein BEP19_09455 [Ammoniphilus oxalaticus]|uniref:Uncharacterized protein n=1 Tax=Ammoniphilus oxalaticus TaxID=66863 RepID=A0A419SKQ5_9BACL|nr:ATP-grasp fold amidoligase family protein [Ammoniphilus oxalaticus]RKD24593.1 hypothetical protein BEP19_09455 [Ammoniphilus oxalaticus]
MKKALTRKQIESLKRSFKKKLGYECDLKDPKTIQEKIQWIKIYGKLERFAKYTDKVEVQTFIIETIGEAYLIPTIGVYEHLEEIEFEQLPQSFVIKATHGSSWYKIVKDKTQIDWMEIQQLLGEWLESSWFSKSKESNYKPLPKRILIQEYLPRAPKTFSEYSFHCFHGEPQFVRIDGYQSLGIYSMDWQPLLERVETTPSNNDEKSIAKPATFAEMERVARALAKDLRYVRVDLFDAAGRVYFNEMTFAPGGGFLQTSEEFGLWIGSLLDLKKYV